MLITRSTRLLITFLLVFFFAKLSAQDKSLCEPACKWSITGGIGISEYAGNMGIGFFQFDLTSHEIGTNIGNPLGKNSPGISFGSINKYHDENFDWSLKAYHGEWGYFGSSDSGHHFHHKASGLEFTPRWKFWPRGNNVRFIPYLTFGIGLRRVQTFSETPFFGIFGNDKEGIYEFILPAGLGFNFKLTKRFALNVQSNIAWTSNRNNSYYGAPHFNWMWNQTIGLTFSFCREKINKCYTF
ncbi:MAG: hypothetical protein H7296_00820 [Bacteroidia bacterium]|nr:hypothetical protein [Bacteroidia bacterium]